MAITDFFNLIVNGFAQLGYPGIFVLMVMESATLPVPSEIVLPLGGYLVYQGRLEFWSVVAVATLGSLIGTMVDYGIGYYLGRHGTSVVLLARFLPLLRTLIAFPAGMVRMEPKKFLAFSAVGILVWDIALVYVGFLAGQNSAQISGILESYFLPLGLASIAILAIVAYRSLRKRPD